MDDETYQISDTETLSEDFEPPPKKSMVRRRAPFRPKVEKTWTNEEITEFIVSVRSRPAVWNLKCPENGKSIQREAAWRSIAEECRKTVNDCKGKWKNLRTIQQKCDKMLKCKTDQDWKPSWRFWTHLQFLIDPDESVGSDAHDFMEMMQSASEMCEVEMRLPTGMLKQEPGETHGAPSGFVGRKRKNAMSPASCASADSFRSQQPALKKQNTESHHRLSVNDNNVKSGGNTLIKLLSGKNRYSLSSYNLEEKKQRVSNYDSIKREEAMNILRSGNSYKRSDMTSSRTQDDYQTFGDYIAVQLRRISNPDDAHRIERKMQKVLMDYFDEQDTISQTTSNIEPFALVHPVNKIKVEPGLMISPDSSPRND